MVKLYSVWKVNRWNDEIKDELVAIFYSYELAEAFIDYQATLCNKYVLEVYYAKNNRQC